MGDEGDLTITAAVDDAGQWVIVTITDNGPGIPPENLSRVFEPFFTTKPPGEGSGLGLNISYNIIVEKQRGDILVDSVLGRTTFTVRLPVSLDRLN